MAKPIDPDEYWAARGQRNIQLVQMDPSERTRLNLDGEFRRLQNEFSMGLFVRGQKPEVRMKKVEQLNSYEAALSRGENPTPPWISRSSPEHQ